MVRDRDDFCTNFNYRHRNGGPGPYNPVKMEMIDTGLAKAPTCRSPTLVQFYRQQIQDIECFVDGPAGHWKDLDGHGTHHCVILTLQVCPNAHLYIARVVEKFGDARDPNRVAAAIRLAADVNKWGVDIIYLSMGWEEDHEAITDALSFAQDQKVLVFAATSNSGARVRSGALIPALRFNVISVDAADGDGDPLTGNPPDTS
jgi:hypothetical protein